MTDPARDTFNSVLNDRVRTARLGDADTDNIIPINPRENVFTEIVLGDLQNIGLVEDCEIVYFEKKLGRSKGKLNGYAVSVDGAEVTLICTIKGSETVEVTRHVPGNEVVKAGKEALQVYLAAREPLHLKMESSSAQRDLIERLYANYKTTRTIRVVILINGTAGTIADPDQAEGSPEIRYDVWDLERLFRASSSGLAYESISIDLNAITKESVPCLSAPVMTSEHRCHLAIFPGEVLYALYHEYGPRLLELNVRSFLQARGKVNRGIRDTLNNDPEHFLPYNNGISATVESLEVEIIADGSCVIRSMKGLQIVNGGQTLASIHRAKDRDKVDLSKVYVQAKITEVEPNQLNDLVPKISRFSNTQNKVNETDFSANHPFHVDIQQLSEQIWAPGEVTRWFYERARGQWEVARVRDGSTPAKLRTFDQKTPRAQKIDKNLLAKACNAWSELPHTVSLGGQKSFVEFMAGIDNMGDAWEPDMIFYKELIAKVILFKCAEKIARQIKFSAYRANAVCYTISLLAYRTMGRVSLFNIWNNQAVTPALEDTIRNWMPRVHEEIINCAGDNNVTEWCKKKECWALIQSMDLDFAPGFESELAEGQPLPNVGRFSPRKGSSASPLTAVERERQAKVMKLEPDEWQAIISWMATNGDYAGFPIQVSGTILGYAAAGWQQVPTPKQTKHLVTYIDSWKEALDKKAT